MLRAFAVAIQAVLDTVLPRKERVARLDSYSLEDIPVSPVEHEMLGTQITTLLEYRTQVVQDLVKALKYDRAGAAAKLLAGALAEYLREEIANIRAFSAKPVILMPVPLHASRIRERGFNQIEKVLRNLPEEFKDGTLSHLDTHSLIRTRATPQQTRLSRAERLRNVEDAFALAHDPGDVHIIMIDDVTTTGATLTEASRPLAEKTVSLLALAHA
jgi:ComF family protein